MKLRFQVIILLVITFFAASITSCKKEKLLTSGGELRFSIDTLTFDTVFTSLGSFTTQVKIYNPQSQKVTISSVRLEGGNASYFHLNVNGVPGNAVGDIELAANDSMYVFATVTVDPKNQDNPFVVNDMLVATMNGKEFKLPFMAYGQDAHYINGDSVGGKTWGNTDKKPYVVIDGAIVENGKTLTIVKGTRIYMHAGALIYVDGTLKIDGTKKDSVIFQGDRLDRKYFGNEGYPGEWGGIYFTPHSNKSTITYAVIINCGGGVVQGGIYLTPDSVDDGDFQLRMFYTTISNSLTYGIVGFRSTLLAQNCLVSSCGAQALATFEGGQYYLDNCDFITYGNKKLSHTDNPTVALVNYRDIDDVSYYGGSLQAQLRNCVIWGSLKTELYTRAKGNGLYSVTMNNCLYAAEDALAAGVAETACIKNTDPLFADASKENFKIQSNSPLKNSGVTITATSLIPAVTDDLDGKPRDASTDIGCYEY